MLDIFRAGLAVATLGLVVAPAALADSGPSPDARAPTAPPGYKIVRGPLMPAPAGPLDSGGQVSCPAGTVVWGGGTAVQGVGGPTESINTSAPNGPTAWRARVNNTGVSTRQFGVDAICAQAAQGLHDDVRPDREPAAHPGERHGEVLTTFAICGQKPAGYKIVRTSGTTCRTGIPWRSSPAPRARPERRSSAAACGS